MAEASSPTTENLARPALRRRGAAPVIGLTGEIGGGKSAVAALLAERGAVVIDADAEGHAALMRPGVRARLVERFGAGVLAAGNDGPPAVDRRALGKIVFADSGSLRDLEAIVHPVMAERFRRGIAEARTLPAVPLIVVDAAILLEAGWESLCDLVVFVDAPRAARIERVAGRGWSAADLEAREAAQWSREAKAGHADYVIPNAEGLDELAVAVNRFIQWLDDREENHRRSPSPESSSP